MNLHNYWMSKMVLVAKAVEQKSVVVVGIAVETLYEIHNWYKKRIVTVEQQEEH